VTLLSLNDSSVTLLSLPGVVTLLSRPGAQLAERPKP
jgi:hypothetical protein